MEGDQNADFPSAWQPIIHLLLASSSAQSNVADIPNQRSIKRKWTEVLPVVSPSTLCVAKHILRKKRRGLQIESSLLSKEDPPSSSQRSESSNFGNVMAISEVEDTMDEDSTHILLSLKKHLESLDSIPEGLAIVELNTLRNIPQLEQACEIMQLHDLRDEVFLFITKEVVVSTMSFRRCSSFLKACMLIKVQNLEHMASRLLFMAIHYVSTMHPGPLIDGLLLPLATDPNSGAIQIDVVNRVLKECLQPPMIFNFLRAFLSSGKDELNDSDVSFSQTQDPSQTECAWTEHTVTMLHNLLDLKLRLPEDLFGLLLAQLDAHAVVFSPSVTFAAMLLTLITKHSQQVSDNKEFVKQIVAKCNNFMVRGLQTKLAKM